MEMHSVYVNNMLRESAEGEMGKNQIRGAGRDHSRRRIDFYIL